MVGGEPCSAEGQVVPMICLGFEDSSELTQSPQSPHWPNWVPSGNGEILWIKNRSEFNFVLLSLPPSGTSYGWSFGQPGLRLSEWKIYNVILYNNFTLGNVLRPTDDLCSDLRTLNLTLLGPRTTQFFFLKSFYRLEMSGTYLHLI